MIRLLGLLAFFALLAIAVKALTSGEGQVDRDRRGTYRPRGRWQDWFSWLGERSARSGLIHVVRRAELADVRDAFSSAAIDSNRPIFRCAACQSFYQDVSVAALAKENYGRCTVCSGADIGPVKIVD